jgi:hypothetical protein
VRQLTQKDIPLLKIGTVLIGTSGSGEFYAKSVVKVVEKLKTTKSVGIEVIYLIKKNRYAPDQIGDKVTAFYNELYLPNRCEQTYYFILRQLARLK